MATTGIGNKSGTPFFNPDGNKGNPMMNKVAMSILCLVFVSAANAEYVEVQFEGVIDLIDGSWLQSHLNESVYVGAPFSGSISYNTDMQDLNPENPNGSTYEISQGLYNFLIEVGDYVFREESQYRIIVTNNLVHQYDSISGTMEHIVVEGPPLPPMTGDDWLLGGVTFEDRTNSALDSDQLPTEFPELSEWVDKASIVLSPGPINAMTGQITSLTVVPEPASLALLAIGGLAVVRRR